MPTGRSSSASWYYKPTNISPRRVFITQLPNLDFSPAQLRLKRSWNDHEKKDKLTARLRKPTLSTTLRFKEPLLSNSYMNRYQSWDGKYIWERMDKMRDCYKAMWNNYGNIRTGSSIGFNRPE